MTERQHGVQNLILNRYRPITEAGRGGYGVVQLAWDTRIQRRVAIKCLRLDALGTASDPYVPRDIPGLDEARTAAMLSDSSIVGVYDFEVDIPNSMAYLIMEYVDGITLTDLMRQYEGALPLNIVTCVFEAVAHALEVAHTNQVLHLDIKPDNVMINRQGQVKVSDFGLAQLSHGMGYGQATGGTIGYMPLEQMRLEAPDVRTDEWALAALTYEMLTGDNPFLADTLDAAEVAIEDAELVIPSAVRDDVDEEVDEAIFGALAIEREDRFESVALFADALLVHLGDSRRGTRELAAVVGGACEDAEGEEDEEDTEPVPRHIRRRISLMDRLGERAQAILFRIWAALACGFVAFTAAGNISLLYTTAGRETPAFWAVLLVCIVAGAVLPAAGSLAAILVLSAALFANDAYVLGVVFLVAGCVWWGGCGRRGHAQANVGVSGVALGAFGLGPLAPLLAGYFLRVPSAAATAAFQALTAFVLACSGALSLSGWNVLVYGDFPSNMEANALALVGDALVWVQALSWVAAAIVLAALCVRGSKPVATVGVVVSAALMVLGIVLASAITAGLADATIQASALAINLADVVPVLISALVVAVCVISVGVPVRSGPQYFDD